MTENNFNTYEFIINDDDEIMLLLYSQNGHPESPILEIEAKERKGFLYRSKGSGLAIEDITEDDLDILCLSDKILVCEISTDKNEDDVKITNAYECAINLI